MGRSVRDELLDGIEIGNAVWHPAACFIGLDLVGSLAGGRVAPLGVANGLLIWTPFGSVKFHGINSIQWNHLRE